MILQSGIELVKSKETGSYYATSKRASISSTFDDATCQNLIGQQIPGSIQKVVSEPYEFTNKVTGEVLTLNQRWVYLKEGETIEEKVIADSMPSFASITISCASKEGNLIPKCGGEYYAVLNELEEI